MAKTTVNQQQFAALCAIVQCFKYHLRPPLGALVRFTRPTRPSAPISTAARARFAISASRARLAANSASVALPIAAVYSLTVRAGLAVWSVIWLLVVLVSGALMFVLAATRWRSASTASAGIIQPLSVRRAPGTRLSRQRLIIVRGVNPTISAASAGV